MIDLDTAKAMQKLMASESDEPDDLRGLRARAVAGMIAEIERLTAENARLTKALTERRPASNVDADIDPTGVGDKCFNWGGDP